MREIQEFNITHPLYSKLTISLTPYEGQPQAVAVHGLDLPLPGLTIPMRSGFMLYFKNKIPFARLAALRAKILSELPKEFHALVSQQKLTILGTANVFPAYQLLVKPYASADEQSATMMFLHKHLSNIIQQNKSISIDATAGHSAMSAATIKYNLEAVLECSENPLTVIKLLRLAIFYPDTTIEAVLRDFLDTEAIDPNIYDDILYVHRVCSGKANLESTFMRMGGLPTLEVQRNFVLNQASELFFQHFASLDSMSLIRLYCSLWMFHKYHHLHEPLSNSLELLLERALNGNLAERELAQSEVIYYLNNACVQAGLNNAHGLDIVKLQALVAKTKFPLLKSILSQAQQHQIRETDPFYLALQRGDVRTTEHILRTVDNPSEVSNQFFNCGRTPLIVLAQLASDVATKYDMIRMLIHFGADPKKLNRFGAFNAVYACIATADRAGLEILLERQDSLSTLCHVVEGTPIQCAEKYAATNPDSVEYAEVLKVIRTLTANKTTTTSAAALAAHATINTAGRLKKEFKNAFATILNEQSRLYHLITKNTGTRAYMKALRNICAHGGDKALDLARMLFDLLKKHSVDYDINEAGATSGHSALHHAAIKNNQQLYNLLIGEGADPSLSVQEGVQTPAELLANNLESDMAAAP